MRAPFSHAANLVRPRIRLGGCVKVRRIGPPLDATPGSKREPPHWPRRASPCSDDGGHEPLLRHQGVAVLGTELVVLLVEGR